MQVSSVIRFSICKPCKPSVAWLIISKSRRAISKTVVDALSYPQIETDKSSVRGRMLHRKLVLDLVRVRDKQIVHEASLG